MAHALTAGSDPATENPYAVFPALAGPDDGDVARQPIVLQGELGLDQLLRGTRLCNRSQVRRDRPHDLMGLIGLSLIGGVVGIWLNDPEFAVGATFQAFAAGLAIFALTCMDGSWLLKVSFYIGRHKSEPFRCTISDSGVKTEYSRITLDDPWPRYSGFSESDDMIVLWRKEQYVPLPIEFSAGPGEWERLREVLHARLQLRQS